MTVALYKAPGISINYPFIPWLSIMALGWVFGRYLVNYMAGKPEMLNPKQLMLLPGVVCLLVFVVFRYFDGYGNMWLHREGNSLFRDLLKRAFNLAFLSLGSQKNNMNQIQRNSVTN